MQHSIGRVGVAVFLVVAVIGGPQLAAQEFEVLASFENPPLAPTGGLVIGPDGLYGAAGGGRYDYGSVFRFTVPGAASSASLTKVYSFPDTEEGANAGPPTHGLVFASDGNFYGLLTGGGWSGSAAAYRFTPAGEQSLLHVFVWPDDGANPEGPLVEFDGSLYGTCRGGGDPDLPYFDREGTIFRLDFDGTMTRLHTFTGGAAGERPEGGMVVGGDGFLYGTTYGGGQHGSGTIFSLDPASGVVSTLYSFDRSTDGSGPTGELTVGENGVLYGAATYGDNTFQNCGTIFSFDPTAANDPFTVLRAFTCAAGETKRPTGGMVAVDGYLYGTTYGDLIDWRYGDGTVYRLDLETLTFEVLWAHDPEENYDGALVMAPDGFIYGQGRGRGPYRPDAGSIFQIDPATGRISIQHTFGPSKLPRKPVSVAEGPDGGIWGASRFGGSSNLGTVFRFIENQDVDVVHEFEDGDSSGWGVRVDLSLGADGRLYGTRMLGGYYATGSIFTIDGTGFYDLLHSFNGTVLRSPAYPDGGLIESRFEPGTFYGTLSGGWGVAGGVFEFDGVGVTPLATFNFETGTPRGRLVQTDQGWLYGVINSYSNITGGYTELGGIFRASPSGGGGRILKLQGFEGQTPQAGMVERAETVGGEVFLYGTAPSGGTSHEGTVFKLSSADELSVVHAFSGEDGIEPWAEMALAGDGNLYGTTRGGGLFGYGTIFAVTPTDDVVTLHNFDHTDGAWPEGALFVASDGNVYGTTVGGGPDGGGVVFRYVLAPELTAKESIEELIDDVRELIDDGEIGYSRGRSLIAELQVALWFLKWNNGESQAIVRMQLFIIKTRNLVNTNQVDPELGAELIARAEAIIELLRA